MMFESIETECYQSLIINIYFRINKYKKNPLENSLIGKRNERILKKHTHQTEIKNVLKFRMNWSIFVLPTKLKKIKRFKQ